MAFHYQRIYEHVLARLDELPGSLTYHNKRHVLDVLEQASQIARSEGIKKEKELQLLAIACLYHDMGFLKTYKGHEEAGCMIARAELPEYGLDKKEVEMVCGLIMATRIPQTATTQLQEIICDADLDYLGRDDFFPIAEDLYREMLHYGFVQNEYEWNLIQVRFLEQHHYLTETCRKKREQKKQEHLLILRKLVGPYPSE